MDPQVVEVLGRNKLVGDLLRAGLEVALAARLAGVSPKASMNRRMVICASEITCNSGLFLYPPAAVCVVNPCS